MKTRAQFITSHGSKLLVNLERIEAIEQGAENKALVIVGGRQFVLEQTYEDVLRLLAQIDLDNV